jgi:hypothetical protein
MVLTYLGIKSSQVKIAKQLQTIEHVGTPALPPGQLHLIPQLLELCGDLVAVVALYFDDLCFPLLFDGAPGPA